MSDTEQLDETLSDFFKEDSVSSEQREFDGLSNKAKLARLNRLIQQTEVYSQIILDNMLEKSLEKKKLQKQQEKLRKREARKEALKAYEEKKASAIKAGQAIPEPPEFSDVDSGSDLEEVDEPKDDKLEDIQPPTPELENKDSKSNSEEQSDSDLEIVQVKGDTSKRSGRALMRQEKLKKRKVREEKLSVKKPKKESSKKTRETRKALESAQTAHNQLQPAAITGCTMKDYQLDGLEWLVTLYENGLNGILADEMGLGKTLQCISLICYLLEHKVKGPFLVVAPLSTVNNWCREFEKFAPSVKVIKYTGVKEDRQRLPFSKNLRGKVVVTSYEIILRDFRKFSRISWSYLTVDEGHRLKNFECLLIQKLKQLDTANRLLLTGTPLQNNLNELWSLLNFILPDIFADLDLFQLWFNVEAFTGEGNSEEDKIFREDVRQKLIKSLHSILKPFLLRRLKKNVVKNLPPKKEYIVYADLTPLQRALYAATLRGDVRRAVVELYAKEMLIHRYPALFNTTEHLDVVRNVLYGLEVVETVEEDEEDTGRSLRKNRREKYSRKLLKRFENSTAEALVDADDSDYDDIELDSEKKTVISLPLTSGEALQGEALQMEVQKQTEELERTLMMSMSSNGLENGIHNGVTLHFHPNGQEERHVLLSPTELESLSSTNIKSESSGDNLSSENGSAKSKVQKTLFEMMLNDKEPNGRPEAGNKSPDTRKAKSNQKKPQTKSPSRRRRRKTVEFFASDDSDIEIVEIKDDSDLSDDERRKIYSEEAIEVASKRAVNLNLKNVLMQLRKVCGSHYTFYDPYLTDGNLGVMEEDTMKQYLSLITLYSGKIQLFKQLLDRLIAEGHKVLVFSQFTTMLDVLEVLLFDQGINFSRLDGNSKQEEREEAMADFSEDGSESAKVFLLSTRAGGLGLNLISADTVILFDSDWNPQMDIQAIDRLHRIGQTKPIKIFRLVVRNSVEELLVVKSFSKRLLERMVIELGEFQLGKVAKKLQEEKIDLDSFKSLKAVLDLGNRLNLYGAHESEYDLAGSSKLLLAAPPLHEPLTKEEIDELMDRSRECYARNPLDTKFANVVAFESSSNNEESE